MNPTQGEILDVARVLDHREAKARTLMVLTSTGGPDPLIAAREAFETLTQRNRELLAEDGDALREAVADQVALLEALAASFAFQAAKAKRPDDARALAGVSIRASSTLGTMLATLHKLAEDRRNGAALPAP